MGYSCSDRVPGIHVNAASTCTLLQYHIQNYPVESADICFLYNTWNYDVAGTCIANPRVYLVSHPLPGMCDDIYCVPACCHDKGDNNESGRCGDPFIRHGVPGCLGYQRY